MTYKNIRFIADLGFEFRRTRKARGIKTTELAKAAGCSRDMLYRLENGEEITTGALLDFLRAMDCTISIEPSGLPTLEEMQQRFNQEESDD
jgi:HTH-type transcriptional regulator/antitoxin HipB